MVRALPRLVQRAATALLAPQDNVFPHARAEKCEGDPVWMHLWVLLSNPQVAWVEVVK